MIIFHFIRLAVWWIFVLAPVAIFFKAIQVVLGWMLIAPFVRDDGHLPSLLSILFEPDDTPIIGDEKFRTREMAGVTSFYKLAEAWGRRNPAYGFDSKIAGIPADIQIIYSKGPDVNWGYDEKTEKAIYTLGTRCILAKTGHWNVIRAFTIPGTTIGFLCSFGWNLQGLSSSATRNLKFDIARKNTDRNRK